jgi:hypothetical protein
MSIVVSQPTVPQSLNVIVNQQLNTSIYVQQLNRNLMVTQPTYPQIVVKRIGESDVIQTNTPITLRNTIRTATRIDECVDVDASGEQDNATLVYDSETDKYVVQQLNLDGGLF